MSPSPASTAAVRSFEDVVAPVALALEQEKRVTEQINELIRIAARRCDFASEQFMQWFIKEQVEEVATMSDLLTVATRNRDDIEDIEEYVAREQGGAAPKDADRASSEEPVVGSSRPRSAS
jgi:ferritin